MRARAAAHGDDWGQLPGPAPVPALRIAPALGGTPALATPAPPTLRVAVRSSTGTISERVQCTDRWSTSTQLLESALRTTTLRAALDRQYACSPDAQWTARDAVPASGKRYDPELTPLGEPPIAVGCAKQRGAAAGLGAKDAVLGGGALGGARMMSTPTRGSTGSMSVSSESTTATGEEPAVLPPLRSVRHTSGHAAQSWRAHVSLSDKVLRSPTARRTRYSVSARLSFPRPPASTASSARSMDTPESPALPHTRAGAPSTSPAATAAVALAAESPAAPAGSGAVGTPLGASTPGGMPAKQRRHATASVAKALRSGKQLKRARASHSPAPSARSDSESPFPAAPSPTSDPGQAPSAPSLAHGGAWARKRLRLPLTMLRGTVLAKDRARLRRIFRRIDVEYAAMCASASHRSPHACMCSDRGTIDYTELFEFMGEPLTRLACIALSAAGACGAGSRVVLRIALTKCPLVCGQGYRNGHSAPTSTAR